MATTALRITNDFIFRYIFSKPENSDLLLDLVNTVLEDNNDRPLLSLEVTNPVDLRSAEWLKEAVLDIRAKTPDGSFVDVEVQLLEQSAYRERSLYYWARTFGGQLERGNPYRDLKPVICINFLGFKLFPNIERRHTCFQLRENREPEFVLTDQLVIHFIEMSKETHDRLQEWIRIFKILEEGHQMNPQDVVLLQSNPHFARLKTAFDECLEDRQARELALSREMFLRDQNNREYEARMKGIAEGEARGEARGEAKGKLENARANAKAMLVKGIPIQVVIEITGLTIEEVQSL